MQTVPFTSFKATVCIYNIFFSGFNIEFYKKEEPLLVVPPLYKIDF